MKRSGIKKLSIVLATMLTVCMMLGCNQTQQKPGETVSPSELIDAAKGGDVKQVKELLKKGAKVNAADEYGETALMKASFNGNTEIAKLLLEKGAKVNAANEYGETALMKASFNGNTEIAKLLLEKGAKVNAAEKNGWTALMVASNNGHTETAKLLIEKGADVNAASESGWTALMFALEKGHTEIKNLLKANGASLLVESDFFGELFSFHNIDDEGKKRAYDWIKIAILAIPVVIWRIYSKKKSAAGNFWETIFWVCCLGCAFLGNAQDTASWDKTTTIHMMVTGKQTYGPDANYLFSLVAKTTVYALFSYLFGSIIFYPIGKYFMKE
ncbi:MAG: ankyrin repeat domain-containing protein [Tannerella sp.]|jgi:ankyrin repeat protein|nr:ankyrin repeat domain-containing protein [Tannerella sp.]